jgi:hypothetical protein
MTNRILPLAASIVLVACTATIGNPVAAEPAAPRVGQPPPGFTSALAEVQGSSLHFVRGGTAPATILVDGFSRDRPLGATAGRSERGQLGGSNPRYCRGLASSNDPTW